MSSIDTQRLSPERQKTADDAMSEGGMVARSFRNLTGYVPSTARGVEAGRPVSAEDAAEDGQRVAYWKGVMRELVTLSRMNNTPH